MSQIVFTSRWGGNSTPPYDELNLAKHVLESEDIVNGNRRIVDSWFYLPKRPEIVYMNQTHSTRVVEVDSGTDQIVDADALVTREKNVGIAVLVADCLPLIIEAAHFTAAIHVGREGLLNGIIENTLEYIAKNTELDFPGKRFSLRAILGPAICGKCYVLNDAHFTSITSAHPEVVSDSAKKSIDIPATAINKINDWCTQNSEKISAPEIITNLNLCTHENQDFYSHRRHKPTGRFAGIVINDGVFK